MSLSCGGSSMENCTYLVQASTTTPSEQTCMYTICKAGPNICRFKFDFTVIIILKDFITCRHVFHFYRPLKSEHHLRVRQQPPTLPRREHRPSATASGTPSLSPAMETRVVLSFAATTPVNIVMWHENTF